MCTHFFFGVWFCLWFCSCISCACVRVVVCGEWCGCSAHRYGRWDARWKTETKEKHTQNEDDMQTHHVSFALHPFCCLSSILGLFLPTCPSCRSCRNEKLKNLNKTVWFVGIIYSNNHTNETLMSSFFFVSCRLCVITDNSLWVARAIYGSRSISTTSINWVIQQYSVYLRWRFQLSHTISALRLRFTEHIRDITFLELCVCSL